MCPLKKYHFYVSNITSSNDKYPVYIFKEPTKARPSKAYPGRTSSHKTKAPPAKNNSRKNIISDETCGSSSTLSLQIRVEVAVCQSCVCVWDPYICCRISLFFLTALKKSGSGFRLLMLIFSSAEESGPWRKSAQCSF